MDKKDKIKAEAIIKRLEGVKKQSYSASELRGRNQMMSRLDRMQDKELVKRISLKQKEIREKKFIHEMDYDLSGNDKDILEMFGIQKKRKVQKHRGGIWNF